jgi:hypothetical protein
MYTNFCVFEVVIVKYNNCAMHNSAVLPTDGKMNFSGVIKRFIVK